jgi:lipopolysaccharide/colanic/teichoic acid biosynthesis glycosyltransferase
MVKRAFDLVIAVPALIVLSPVIGAIAVFVRCFIGRPVLFRQERPGLNGRPFTLLKFRTMQHACDASGELLPDDQRLGRAGRFLRSTSLDELPELVNVVRGDMSLVGPRPLLMEYLKRYSERQALRHRVRPGVTGWAQVNGRNALTWDARLEHDVWYVEHASFALDLRILWKTALLVCRREGITAPGHATSPRFTGSPEQSG